MNKIIKKVKFYRKLVVVKHTIFSLIISIIAMDVVSSEIPSIYVIGWILVAMIGAIIGGSATSSVIDMKIDREEDYKYNRKIPTGLINKQEGILLAAIGYSIMVLASKMLSDLCLMLSPIAIVLLIVYGYFKKNTWARYFILGVVSSSAPIGVCIAITGKISFLSIAFGIVNMLWVSASDILYSIKRYNFNIKNGIQSFATSFGIEKSITIAYIMHIIAMSVLIYIVVITNKLGILYCIAISVFILISYIINITTIGYK